MAPSTPTTPATLAAAMQAAQVAADAADWQAAARQLTHAADLAYALARQTAPARPAAAAARPVPLADAPAAPVGPAPAADADPQAIADWLHGLDTVDDGAAYLAALGLDKPRLLAVASALLLTRVDRLSRPALQARILDQAIAARRKFAGLRKW